MFNLFYYSTMKNIKLFSLLFVVAAMIFAGCTKETESVEPGGGEDEGTEEGLVYKEFTVGVSESSGSKSRTALGDDGESVLWQVGDMIRVFADVEGADPDGYTFTVKEIQDDGKSATIGGEVANAAKYYGLYPYDAYSEEGGLKKENGSVYISANIPDVQKLPVNGGYDPKACISVANLGDGTSPSQFKLACGMIGLTFTSTDNTSIKELDVSFNDYSIIEGCMKIDVVNNGGETRFNLISKAQNFKLIPDNSGGNFKNNVTYYVCLPAFNASQRIDIDFIEAESGATLTKSVTGQIQRAYLEKSPTLTLSNSDYNKEIATATDFKKWYEEGINQYPKVILTDNIDMSGISLISKSFSGIFDGGGHTISNFSMKPAGATDNNGLFSNLDGAQVMNLTLEKVTIDGGFNAGLICGESNSNSNTYISGCHILNSTISNAFYIGGIVGVCNNAIIDGCSIENITMNGKVTVGGLVGELDASSVIMASYITGSISSDVMYGGLVGKWSDSNAMLISCYSFTNLQGLEGGYISNGNNVHMYSSWYVSDKLSEYPDGTKTVQGLKDVMDNYIVDGIDKSMNSYLKQANSGHRYVVNPNYSVEDFSTPPLILQKAQ